MFFSRCLFEHHAEAVNLDEAAAFAAEETFTAGVPSLVVHDPCRVGGIRARPGVKADWVGCCKLTPMLKAPLVAAAL